MVTKNPLRQVLRWNAAPTVCFRFLDAQAYIGFTLVDASMFQNREHRHFDRLLDGRSSSVSPLALPIAGSPAWSAGVLIPRLGVSVIVMEGTGRSTLRRAVGHIPGTPFPGHPGNRPIPQHAVTRSSIDLRNIRQNDIIILTTLLGMYRYRVMSTRIVGPDEIGTLDPTGKEILTLVTCYPFYFVRSAAPDRFIVRAERIT